MYMNKKEMQKIDKKGKSDLQQNYLEKLIINKLIQIKIKRKKKNE